MGRNQKLKSDPSRGKEHQAGAPAQVVQVIAHNQLGAICYVWPRHWVFHARAAEQAANQLATLHQRLVQFPVHGESSLRSVDDLEYIEAVYRAGTQMVVQAILTLQHLCEEIERTTHVELRGSSLDDRLREALAAANLTPPAQRSGHAKFVELEGIRDAIEHPKQENVYNGDPGQWDRVPLAWLLSERGLLAFVGYADFTKSIVDDWEARKQELDMPGELTIERGIHSQLQFKKPPK